jgi:hypothetical protein
MADLQQSERDALLLAIPNILQNLNKSMLYIGASTNRAHWLEEFTQIYQTDVLEIWQPNLEFITKNYKCNTILGDVRTTQLKFYDIIFWWHGPEHIHKNELPTTLNNLENKTNLIVLACPKGSYPQDTIYGNPYEEHLWNIEPEDLNNLGYSTSIIVRKPIPDALLAWKFIKRIN